MDHLTLEHVPVGMQPLRVTAHLATGLAHTGPWGIALDGLLAAVEWDRTKRALRAAGTEPAKAQ